MNGVRIKMQRKKVKLDLSNEWTEGGLINQAGRLEKPGRQFVLKVAPLLFTSSTMMDNRPPRPTRKYQSERESVGSASNYSVTSTSVKYTTSNRSPFNPGFNRFRNHWHHRFRKISIADDVFFYLKKQSIFFFCLCLRCWKVWNVDDDCKEKFPTKKKEPSRYSSNGKANHIRMMTV